MSFSKILHALAAMICFLAIAAQATAQEAKIHHGFLFFASEKYTVDEETYSIYEDGREFRNLIKESPEALAAFGSYRTWHITGIVSTSLSLAAIVFGAVTFMPGVDKQLPSPTTGIASFSAAGGLLVLGLVFEFISWGRISDAAELYNKGLMDEGPALHLDRLPTPRLAVGPDQAHLTLGWQF